MSRRELGNLNSSMALECHICGWRPPEDMQMEGAQLHVQVEHDTDEIKLDLVVVCTCGAAMGHTASRPTGGGSKDYFRCGACGNTGHVARRTP